MNEENVASIRTSTEDRVVLSESYILAHEECVELFSQWSEMEQVDFVEKLLAKMCHSQLGRVDCFLRPMLQRDFISALPGILSLLNYSSPEFTSCVQYSRGAKKVFKNIDLGLNENRLFHDYTSSYGS